jgi:hypothetical protein
MTTYFWQQPPPGQDESWDGKWSTNPTGPGVDTYPAPGPNDRRSFCRAQPIWPALNNRMSVLSSSGRVPTPCWAASRNPAQATSPQTRFSYSRDSSLTLGTHADLGQVFIGNDATLTYGFCGWFSPFSCQDSGPLNGGEITDLYAAFDDWRATLRQDLMDATRGANRAKGITLGQAQKWINMAVKYASGGRVPPPRFERAAHMPIDQVLLEELRGRAPLRRRAGPPRAAPPGGLAPSCRCICLRDIPARGAGPSGPLPPGAGVQTLDARCAAEAGRP